MKKAFTLAEVLITLGIIGIIAAMTLPFLIGRYNEKVTLHKLETILTPPAMEKDLHRGTGLLTAIFAQTGS